MNGVRGQWTEEEQSRWKWKGVINNGAKSRMGFVVACVGGEEDNYKSGESEWNKTIVVSWQLASQQTIIHRSKSGLNLILLPTTPHRLCQSVGGSLSRIKYIMDGSLIGIISRRVGGGQMSLWINKQTKHICWLKQINQLCINKILLIKSTDSNRRMQICISPGGVQRYS